MAVSVSKATPWASARHRQQSEAGQPRWPKDETAVCVTGRPHCPGAQGCRPWHGNRFDVTAYGCLQGGQARLPLWAVRLVLGRRRGQRRGGAIGAHDERRSAGGSQGQSGHRGQIDVFHACIVGQTFETVKSLILLAAKCVPQLSLCATHKNKRIRALAVRKKLQETASGLVCAVIGDAL